jgi:hypothetical protein
VRECSRRFVDAAFDYLEGLGVIDTGARSAARSAVPPAVKFDPRFCADVRAAYAARDREERREP